MSMLILAFIVIVIEIIPMVKKKQGKESAVLLLFGVITLAYGYYYNTHSYTASLVNILFKIFNVR
ncbi:MAG: hypothetical protein APF77_13180 [Clostridia bacterium BRH_c25]|nr:MAG: hypothetical protein APF77_13180 [Clostridia bacterium BRH_c25]